MKLSNFKTLAAMAGVIFLYLAQPTKVFSVNCGTYDKLRYSNDKKNNKTLADFYDTIKQKYYISPSGNFKIFYDTTGGAAVNLIDENQNGIPDWVDSTAYWADYCYKFYTDSLKYPSLALQNDPDGNFYYIYISQFNEIESYYAYTLSTDLINGNPNRKYSYVVIDNDYSANDGITDTNTHTKRLSYSTHGYDALKITIAHEMFHGIQFANYGIDGSSLYEMAATWMEQRIFPETLDYMQYVRALFKNFRNYPFGINKCLVSDNLCGYYYTLLCKQLYMNYGDTIIKRMWEIIGTRKGPYFALDSALKENNSSLNDEWLKFITNINFTGSRANKIESYFNEINIRKNKGYFDLEYAQSLPNFAFRDTSSFDAPVSLNNFLLYPYEISPHRMLFLSNDKATTNDTLDLIFTNLDIHSAGASLNVQLKGGYYCIDYNDNESEITPVSHMGKESGKYYNISKNSDNLVSAVPFIYLGEKTTSIDYAFPNPFRLSQDKYIYLPAIESSPIFVNKINEVEIVDIDGTSIYSSIPKNIEVIPIEGKRAIKISRDELPNNLSTGVYIYSIKYDGEIKIGKIAIKN